MLFFVTVFIVVNVVADLCCAILDPRIRLTRWRVQTPTEPGRKDRGAPATARLRRPLTAAPTAGRARTGRRSGVRPRASSARCCETPGGRFGLAVVVALCVVAVLAPRIAPWDPFVIGADSPLAAPSARAPVRNGRAGARRHVADDLRGADLAERGLRLGRCRPPRRGAARARGRLPGRSRRHRHLALPRHGLRLPGRAARHRRGGPPRHRDRERRRGGRDHQRPDAGPSDPRGRAEPAERAVRGGGARAGRRRHARGGPPHPAERRAAAPRPDRARDGGRGAARGCVQLPGPGQPAARRRPGAPC